MAKLTDFSHGFNNRIDPTKLNDGITPVYIVNADISSGSVATVKGPTLIQDSLVYQRTSGYLFFVTYDTPKPPALNPPSVTQQQNTVEYIPASYYSNPPVPESVKINVDALPQVTNLPDNLGPRQTKFLGTWNVYGNGNKRLETGLVLQNELKRQPDGSSRSTKATFSGGYLFLSTKPKPEVQSPRQDSNGDIKLPTGIFDGDPRAGVFRNGPITIVLKVQGKPKQVFRGTAGGVGYIEGGQYINLNLGAQGNAAQEAFNLTDEQAATAVVDIWSTYSLQNWSLTIPDLDESRNDRLWITYVKFNDDNTASFTKPTQIERRVAPTPLTEITKQPNITLDNTGLIGHNHISGYLYLSRALDLFVDGSNVIFNAANSPTISGSLVNGELEWMRVTGLFDPANFSSSSSTKLTIPPDLDNAGTYIFDPAISEPNFLDRSILFKRDSTVNVGTPNFTLTTAQLQRVTNPPRLIHRNLSSTLPAPTVVGGRYDTANDTLTLPEDQYGNVWTYDPFILTNQETWRIAVLLQDSSNPLYGTPIKVYDGSALGLVDAREKLVRVPAGAALMSRDRPIQVAAGGDLNRLQTATPFFHYKDGIWYFGETDRDYVEYQDRLYFTQDAAVPTYIKEDTSEAAMGIPRPNPTAVSGITITGSNLPGAWNPVVREIDLGDASANPFTGNYGRQFQYFDDPFTGFDQSRIIKTADSNVGGNEIYNSVIETLATNEAITNTDEEFKGINHLQIILNVHTSDATLINVGPVNCSNFRFSVKYGSGGGGHGRPTPIAVINRNTYYNMVLRGGSWHRPIWELGSKIGRYLPRDTNRTVTFNRLPKPIPQGVTHTIDWEVAEGGGTSGRVDYRLGAFAEDVLTKERSLIRTFDFNITTDANKVRFIISDKGTVGWTYKLYRAFGSTYHEISDFGNSRNSPNSRNVIGIDNLEDTSSTGKPAIGTISQTLPTIIRSNTTYAITNVNEEEDLESVPTVIETQIENNANANIQLSQIPIETDPRVEYRYIYKIDSVYPQWGFIGKIGPRETTFEDNVNFTQGNLFVYTNSLTESTPPLPEVAVFTSDTAIATDAFKQREAGQWDGKRLTPPVGWKRERSAFEEGERLYRSRVILSSSTSGTVTSYSATYSIPEEISDGLIVRVGEPLNSARNFEPSNAMRFLTLYSGTMFGADGNVLYFSRYGLPHYWPKEHYFEFDEPITGLLSVQQGLLIFTRFQTHILVGSTANDFRIALVSGEQGCVNHKTAVFVKGTPIWISDDGIVSYSNGRVEVISREFITDSEVLSINWKDVKNAVYWKDIYHVLLGSGNAKESQQADRFDNKVLCLDMRYFPKVYMCDGIEFPEGNEELPERIGRFDNNQLYMVTRHSDRLDDYRLWSLGTDSSKYLTCTWESQDLTDGDVCRLKQYDEIYFTYKGQIAVTPIIDGQPIMENGEPKVYTLPKLVNDEGRAIIGTKFIRIPAQHSRGYTIGFRIRVIGSDEEYRFIELSYEPTYRKDNPGVATPRSRPAGK